MSGIAGIVAFDTSQPDATMIETMTSQLARRGPDATGKLVDRQIALGHTLLATTPEALHETLPLAEEASGCVITADARIDNREELIDALGIGGETRTIGDGELILRAYLQWGEECPAHLLGDFAFVIWDPRVRRLMCARDPIGMRQLLYHHDGGRRFIFATEAAAILALGDVDAPLNHDRVADFLGNMEGADLHSTFFRGIERLPPAHVLTVDRAGLAMHRYWEPALEPLLELPSDDAYAEAFRSVFTAAVACRLRSAGPVGAMLSGGIDSNAAAAVAAQLLAEAGRAPLATFSAAGPDPSSCAETRAIHAAVQSPLFAPTLVDHDTLGAAREELAMQVAQSDEPFDGNMGLIRAVYRAAQHAGVRVVLDGVGGDIVLSSDFHVAFLLREGRIAGAIREARGGRLFWGQEAPSLRSLLAGFWQAFAPRPLRGARFWHGRRAADRAFVDTAKAHAPSLDTREALARRRLVQRRDFDNDCVDRQTRVRPLVHPNLVVGRERYDRVAGAYGIEPRDPFLDLRVIRFCLSLPRDQLQRDGWPKWILRRVMAPDVPAAVVWRRGKDHVGPDFTRVLVEADGKTCLTSKQATEQPMLITQYENIFLSNWFAYMLRSGRLGGTVKKGFHDDDQ